MYQVIFYADHKKVLADSKVIHEPHNHGEKVTSGEVLEEINAIPICDLSLPVDNVAYGRVKEYVTCVEVRDLIRDKTIFDGRVIGQDMDMDSSGEHTQYVECEGKLGYLRDSTQEFRATQKTKLKDYFNILLTNHNKQVEAHKKIYVGTIKPRASDDNIYRSIGYASTADTIKDKIIDRLGGYLVLEDRADGKMYLNYYHEYGEEKATPIQLARNLQSAAKSVDMDDLASIIVPLGEEIPKDSDEGTERLESDFAKERYNIKSVNKGSLELVDEQIVALIGRRRKEVIFTNSKVPSAIKSQGQNYLNNQRIALVSWKVNVLDISLQDESYAPYELYNFYPLDNPYISGQKELLQVVTKKTDIIVPMLVSLDIGNKAKTLSQYQNENNSQIEQLKPNTERILAVQDKLKDISGGTNAATEVASAAQASADSANAGVSKLSTEMSAVATTQEQLLEENKVLRQQNEDLDKRLKALENK